MTFIQQSSRLTPKLLEKYGYVLSTVATDALVLKHQAISIHIADQLSNALDQFQTKILRLQWITLKNAIKFWKKLPNCLELMLT